MNTIKGSTSVLRLVRSGEHFEFHLAVTNFLSGKIDPHLPLLTLWNSYKELFEKEDIIYKQTYKYIETEELRIIDRNRDDIFLVIKRIIEAALYSHNQEVKTAGKKLDNILHKYRNANQKTYAENTSLIYNFIQDLRLSKNKAYITLLSLSESIDTLERYNIEFDLTYNQRSAKINQQDLEGKMYQIRPLVDKAFAALSDAINTLFKSNELVEKDEDKRLQYTEIIQEVNAYIKRLELIYSRRNAKYKAKKDQEMPIIPGNPPGPGPVIPHFMIDRQVVIYDGLEMNIISNDIEKFNLQFKDIKNGEVRMYLNEQLTNYFSLFASAVVTDDINKFKGFLIDPPENKKFLEPFEGTEIFEARFIYYEDTICILDNIKLPKMVDV